MGAQAASNVARASGATVFPMSDIEMFQGNPLDFAEDVIGVFRRCGRRYSRERLDWYFGSPGSVPIRSWMLWSRRMERVVGLVSVVPRVFRHGTSFLTAGVAGNLFVDEAARGTLGALQLLRAAESLVSNQNLDLLLAIPGPETAPLLMRIGFRPIGRWRTRVFVLSSRSQLRLALGTPGIFLAPFVDLSAMLLRRVGGPKVPLSRFDVIELNAADVRRLSTHSWASSSGEFELSGDPLFLENHYLRDAYKAYTIWGISDGTSISGYVVVNSTRGGFHICDCRTDWEKLSHTDAIIRLCGDKRFAHSSVAITTLCSAPIEKSLSQAGAVRVPVRFGGIDCSLLGYWRPNHPLASKFSDPARWNIYFGTNDV